MLPGKVGLRGEFWLTTHADPHDLGRVKAVSASATDVDKGAADVFRRS